MTSTDKKAVLEDLFEGGIVSGDKVPPGCPVLTSGSAHDAVYKLVRALNDHLGVELPLSDIVTPDVLRSVQTFRATYGVPEEVNLYPASAYIGPNTWAALAALDGAPKAPEPAFATDDTTSIYL